MASEHFDVIVVGAGISGIGAGHYLKQRCPDHTFAILEGRGDIGGTWDLFRYPGVRSDSDMHTLGYSFKPWKAEKAIADGPSIMEYLRETVAEDELMDHIRFGHLVERAEWSTDRSTWTLRVDRGGEPVTLTCNFLFMCSGYYSYRGGYRPDFPGEDRFAGTVVHPQDWPEDLDYRGRKVVVIGSGATAMTLVPAMADDVDHITMLQRSATYVVSRPDVDELANRLRRILPDRVAYAITRKKNTFMQQWVYRQTRVRPDRVRQRLLDRVREAVGEEELAANFTPDYDPWDQRLCLIPNADLFDAINSGKASVVTGTIDTWTEDGILLEDGTELEADIIVTATGLQLVTIGEMDFVVDGEPVDFSRTWTYKGLAYSDVPNLVSVFGYVNASWTLRVDLNCDYVCRLLRHMRETGTTQCTPRLRPSDRGMRRRDYIEDFPAGYMQRMMPLLPMQGDRPPWLHTQSYDADRKLVGQPVDDGVMTFTSAPDRAPAGAVTT